MPFISQRGGTDLGGPEAEGSCGGVGLLPVLQDQSPVLAQSQVMTGGEVTQAEGLTPANVAAAPAAHKNTGVTRHRCGQMLTFWFQSEVDSNRCFCCLASLMTKNAYRLYFFSCSG